MLKKETAEAIATALGLDISQLTAAITSETEVEIAVPKGLFVPDSEREAFETRLKKSAYTDGKQAGTEMLIKEWKEKEGIDVEGKTMDVFVTALKNKVTTETKTPVDEKVTKLTSDLETLRKTYTTEIGEKESVISQLQGSLKSTKIDATLRAFVPEGLQTLKPDQFLHMARFEYGFDVDENGQLIAKKGDQIVTDKLQKPRPVGDVLSEYAATQGWIKKNGRAGGNEPGGKSGVTDFKTLQDAFGYLHDNKILPESAEGKAIIRDAEQALNLV